MDSKANAGATKRRRVGLSLALFLFAVYLLIYRGGFHSVDEVSMFAVTENLAKFIQINTNQIAWTQWTTSQAEAQGFFGTDGHVYSKKGLALSLAQAPFYGLALLVPGLGMLQTVSLLNAGLTALTGLLLFMFLWRMNFSTVVAVVTALVFGTATLAFVYAKYLFSEPLAGFLLLLAAYMLFAYRQEAGLRHVIIAGVAAGFAVLARANNLFLLPIFWLYLLWVEKWQMGRPANQYNTLIVRATRVTAIFALALAVPGLVLLAYNGIRSGNPLQTGYDLTLFSPNILLGFYKLLFSPLRGLFIYSPILILSFPGWWMLRRAYPAESWLFLGIAGITLTLFAAWSSGEGLSWGSRFLVPIVPFFAICLAPVINAILSRSSKSIFGLRVAFYALVALSLGIQLLGATINPWIFLSKLQTDFGGEFFLENTAALYNFQYSQIAGQLQAFSVGNSDLVWWQPWGFDGLAFVLSLTLALLSGWYVWRQTRENYNVDAAPHHSQASLHLLVQVIMFAAITWFLLTRYYQTDLQFGPPNDTYTQALNTVSARSAPNESILTVAQYAYHVPMNRFKAKNPLIGFAQQTWPLPKTALPLLRTTLAQQNIRLVTLGFPPAAANNATEQWLSLNAFKAKEEWLPNNIRLVHFTTTQPNTTRKINIPLNNEIELVAVNVFNPVQPGQAMPVEFTWQALTPPAADYNIFLQLLNHTGALVAQHDSPPNGGYSPTSGWQVDQQTTSRHALALPAALPPGDYRIIAGLYNPATGERLPTAANSDFVELGNITIVPTS